MRSFHKGARISIPDVACDRNMAVIRNSELATNMTSTTQENAPNVSSESPVTTSAAVSRRNPKLATLGVGDILGDGDSNLVLDLLPPDLAAVAFEKIRDEVAWDSMFHRGMCAVCSSYRFRGSNYLFQ